MRFSSVLLMPCFTGLVAAVIGRSNCYSADPKWGVCIFVITFKALSTIDNTNVCYRRQEIAVCQSGGACGWVS